MSPMKVRPRVSYADLERAPEDGRRYELYDGEVFVVPAPFLRHQIVQHRIAEMIYGYADRHGGVAGQAPLDIVFSEHNALQPDVVYFSPDRAHLVDINRVIRDAPNLCVEVLSPSTAATDRGKKMQTFARYGVREYWIVDPVAESIEIYELDGAAYDLRLTATGDKSISPSVMPGLTFSPVSLFPGR
jgi:Uma2 family endonuclease